MTAKKKLGQILLDAGVLDEYQLKSALGYQKKWGGQLGDVLVENRFVTEEALVQAIREQTGIAAVDLANRNIPDYLLKLIPQDLAEKYCLVPVGLEGESGKPTETLVVAMSDPTNLAAVDEVRFKSSRRVKSVVAGRKAIETAIALHYRGESGPLDFEVDPGDVQFGGQEVELNGMVVQHDGQPAVPEPNPSATPAVDLDDPFAELDSLVSPAGPDAVPAAPAATPANTPAPDAPAGAPAGGLDDDPFAELDSLVSSPPPGPQPAAAESEQLEELEVLEELEPLVDGSPPPPPGDRDLSLFGDALGALPDEPSAASQAVSGADPKPEPASAGTPDLADLPDLEPAGSDDMPTIQGSLESPGASGSGPDMPPSDFDIGEGDLDLDSFFEPMASDDVNPLDEMPTPQEPDPSSQSAAKFDLDQTPSGEVPVMESAPGPAGDDLMSSSPEAPTAIIKEWAPPPDDPATESDAGGQAPSAPADGSGTEETAPESGVLETPPAALAAQAEPKPLTEPEDELPPGTSEVEVPAAAPEAESPVAAPEPELPAPDAEPELPEAAAGPKLPITQVGPTPEPPQDDGGEDEADSAPAIKEPAPDEDAGPPAVASKKESVKSDAMKALLSRVGLDNDKRKTPSLESASQVSADAPGGSVPDELLEEFDDSSLSEEETAEGPVSDPTLAALIRLLVKKGLIDGEELADELKR